MSTIVRIFTFQDSEDAGKCSRERDEGTEENKLSHYAVPFVVLSLLSLPPVIQIISNSFPFVTQALLQEEKREIYRRLQQKRLSGHIAQDALLSVR